MPAIYSRWPSPNSLSARTRGSVLLLETRTGSRPSAPCRLLPNGLPEKEQQTSATAAPGRSLLSTATRRLKTAPERSWARQAERARLGKAAWERAKLKGIRVLLEEHRGTESIEGILNPESDGSQYPLMPMSKYLSMSNAWCVVPVCKATLAGSTKFGIWGWPDHATTHFISFGHSVRCLVWHLGRSELCAGPRGHPDVRSWPSARAICRSGCGTRS